LLRSRKALTKVQAAVLVLVLVIAVVGAFYMTRKPTPTPTPTPSPTPSPTPPPEEQVVKIGVIYPLTGFLAPFGQDCLKGVQTAIEMANEEGILPGVKLEIVVADSQSNPTVATSEAERLITVEGVDLVIGSYAGSLAMAISEVCERYKTPMFETIAAPNELTLNRGFEWVFRFGPMGLHYGYVAVDFLVEYLAPRMGWDVNQLRIAVVHEDSSYGTSCADGDVERLQYYGLEPVTREAYSARTTDLSSLITKLKQLNVDIVLITSYAADAQLFIRQSYELGFKPKAIIGHSAGYELPQTAEAVGDKIVGLFVVGFPLYGMNTSSLSPEVQQDLQRFNQYYQQKYGSLPASWGAKAFSAIYHVVIKGVFKIALEKYGEITKETIKAAFLDVDIPDGGTFVGFGAKFNPPGHVNAGDNMRAVIHPVCQWFNATAEGLIAVWPEQFAIKEPIPP